MYSSEEISPNNLIYNSIILGIGDGSTGIISDHLMVEKKLTPSFLNDCRTFIFLVQLLVQIKDIQTSCGNKRKSQLTANSTHS